MFDLPPPPSGLGAIKPPYRVCVLHLLLHPLGVNPGGLGDSDLRDSCSCFMTDVGQQSFGSRATSPGDTHRLVGDGTEALSIGMPATGL